MDDKYFEALKNSVPNSEQSTINVSNGSRQAYLTVKVDIDCKLYCDGDFLDLFEANRVKKISIEVGQHLMTIESEHCDGVSEDHVVDAAEVGKNYLLLVNGMKEKEQIIIQKKEETKRHDEETLKAEKLKEQEQEVKELVRKGKECYNNNGYEAAFKYFKQASEYSDPEAQYELGLCFFEGKGVNCDINEAIKMWKLSAEQGFVIAQYRLGMEIPDEFLEDDEKVKEGMKWLEMAAKQGYSEAQWQLSNFYATDWLPVYDPLLASQWMKAAAEQGHAEAIEALKFRG
jgi:hypothetical protein